MQKGKRSPTSGFSKGARVSDVAAIKATLETWKQASLAGDWPAFFGQFTRLRARDVVAAARPEGRREARRDVSRDPASSRVAPGVWPSTASRSEHGLAEILDQHDIAFDLVHTSEEDPLPI